MSRPPGPFRPSLADRLRWRAGALVEELLAVPVLVLEPHSRCNCRCVMCDIWRANQAKRELGAEVLAPHLEELEHLGLRWVVLSGGEALMHSNLWALCEELRRLGVAITLLSTGLLLEAHAAEVCRFCDEVIVSLDGPPATHDAIRNVPHAFERLAAGVTALRRERPRFPVSARCVVQRANHRELDEVVETARQLELDQVSFLAADLTSEAFNRPGGWDAERAATVALTPAETSELARVVESLIARRRSQLGSFIAEDAPRLRRIVRHFRAALGELEAVAPRCNAPWVSAVVEADGEVRPCFFHPSFGNLHEAPIGELLRGERARAFRRQLEVASNPVCRRCVCSLSL